MKFEENLVFRENGEEIGKIVEEQISETLYAYGFKSYKDKILLLDDFEAITEYIQSL